MRNRHAAVVIPVLNDSGSLRRLVRELDTLELSAHHLHLVVVDDGSSPQVDVSLPQARSGGKAVRSVRTVRLACNLGHQRAIAIGLVAATGLPELDSVLVMDGDGEDRPEDVVALLDAAAESPSSIILAERSRRSETLGFRLFYRVYRMVFHLLTGQKIRFGNFCLLPMHAVHALVHTPSLWNNLAATVKRSRLPMRMIPTRRGTRYAGSSKMSFVGLAVHGLSAISVYTDVVLMRIIVGATAAAGAFVLLLAVVVGIRLFTGLAIPGWASFMAASLVILLLQALLIAGVALFQLLSFRSVQTFIPAIHAGQFLLGHDTPAERQPRSPHTAGIP
ncbi:MAG TPA: glycosyltransferase family 2 protein [Longimicrobiaceae bacterium]|nr:glycosyltransferase family 2 protein [Longimicrobiaceae bacterium]